MTVLELSFISPNDRQSKFRKFVLSLKALKAHIFIWIEQKEVLV